LDSTTGHRPPSLVWASWRTQRVRLAGAPGVVAELLCHFLAAAAAEKSGFMLADSRLDIEPQP
jgi:hypothetical protein